MLSSIFSPTDPGLAVFTLDADGPRFEPERADAHADAIDAGHDAWVTINLANIRADLLGVTREPAPPAPKPGELADAERTREARIEAAKRDAVRQRTIEDRARERAALSRRDAEDEARRARLRAPKKKAIGMGIMSY